MVPVVNNGKLCLKKKPGNILSSLPWPHSKNLYPRQLKNNQNQMDTGTQKKWNCWGKLLHTHLYLWDKKKLVANIKKLLNSLAWHSGCPNYQLTAFVFFILRSVVSSLPWPHSKNLYPRQLKNNQNQMDTTGGQNLKKYTAEWLSGFL
jgi:hypothetical protein